MPPRSPRDARRRGVAMIYQELSLAPHLSVAENVLLGAEPRRRGLLDREAARRRTLEVLTEFGHPEIDPGTRVSRLPIAARQVVEICRAIAGAARVVLMDEPTSSLQRADVDRLFALIRRLSERGVAIVYISHFLEEVTRGRRPLHRAPRRPDGGGRGPDRRDERRPDRADGGPRRSTTLFPRGRRARRARWARGAESVGRRRGPRRVVALRRGEVLGVAGLVGAGRTEMLRAIFGLDSGRRRRGRPGGRRGARPQPAARRLRQGIGFLSEDRKGEGLALGLSVADNVTLSRLDSAPVTAFWTRRRQQRARTQDGRARSRSRCRGPDQPVARPLRRQPAEGRVGAAPAPGRRRAAARRADPRDRRGEQGADLQADRRAGLARQGGADGQLLPAGAAGRLRPHRGHEPRTARRRTAGRPSGPRSPSWRRRSGHEARPAASAASPSDPSSVWSW